MGLERLKSILPLFSWVSVWATVKRQSTAGSLLMFLRSCLLSLTTATFLVSGHNMQSLILGNKISRTWTVALAGSLWKKKETTKPKNIPCEDRSQFLIINYYLSSLGFI